ncbi:hypothetical protein [Peribacillus simplex]|uniref:hypothetical protein n=1 Tax=Peribacillus simplex TaxID=1478 RepID=UPI001E2CECAF|nr:hypothetical protein [Peribacillus simplex]
MIVCFSALLGVLALYSEFWRFTRSFGDLLVNLDGLLVNYGVLLVSLAALLVNLAFTRELCGFTREF